MILKLIFRMQNDDMFFIAEISFDRRLERVQFTFKEDVVLIVQKIYVLRDGQVSTCTQVHNGASC